MQLPLYEFTYKNGVSNTFDPLLDDVDEEYSNEVPLELVEEYTNKLINCWGYKQKNAFLETLAQQGIEVVDNSRKVIDSERQCMNSVVQGKPKRLNCPSAVNSITQRCIA